MVGALSWRFPHGHLGQPSEPTPKRGARSAIEAVALHGRVADVAFPRRIGLHSCKRFGSQSRRRRRRAPIENIKIRMIERECSWIAACANTGVAAQANKSAAAAIVLSELVVSPYLTRIRRARDSHHARQASVVPVGEFLDLRIRNTWMFELRV